MALSPKKSVFRLWEVRIIQVPFTERAPAGCLQYHTDSSGVIQTMNFAENGRHLAEQEYTICTRQNEGMCSIAYEQCDENSFRIGPNNGGSMSMNNATGAGQEMADDVAGSGDGGGEGRSMDVCSDRITIPCAFEDFMKVLDGNVCLKVEVLR